MGYENYDECIDEYGFKVCPECGYVMKEMGERYDLNVPYEDKWWECTNPNCGYCIDRNQNC